MVLCVISVMGSGFDDRVGLVQMEANLKRVAQPDSLRTNVCMITHELVWSFKGNNFALIAVLGNGTHGGITAI